MIPESSNVNAINTGILQYRRKSLCLLNSYTFVYSELNSVYKSCDGEILP